MTSLASGTKRIMQEHPAYALLETDIEQDSVISIIFFCVRLNVSGTFRDITFDRNTYYLPGQTGHPVTITLDTNYSEFLFTLVEISKRHLCF